MTTIPEPVASFIDAVNRHDEQAFLDAFSTEGYVDDWGREFTDRAAIKQWSDKEFIGAQGTLTPQETEVDGRKVTVIGDWASNHANGRSKFTFMVSDGKVASMTIREG